MGLVDLEALAESANEAKRLAGEGRLDEAVGLAEQLMDRWGRNEAPEVREWVSYAMQLRCQWLRSAGNDAEFLAAVAELQERDADVDQGSLRAAAAAWIEPAVWRLARTDRIADAIKATDDLLSRFEHEPDSVIAAELGEILFKAASALTFGEPMNGRPFTILGLWACALGRSLRLRPLTPLKFPRALRAAEQALGQVGLPGWNLRRERYAQSVKILDSLIAKSREIDDAAFQKLRLRSQMSRAVILLSLGRLRASNAAFNEVFDYGSDGIAEIVRSARVKPTGNYESTDVAAAVVAKALPRDKRVKDDAAAATDLILDETLHGPRRDTRLVAWVARRFR